MFKDGDLEIDLTEEEISGFRILASEVKEATQEEIKRNINNGYWPNGATHKQSLDIKYPSAIT